MNSTHTHTHTQYGGSRVSLVPGYINYSNPNDIYKENDTSKGCKYPPSDNGSNVPVFSSLGCTSRILVVSNVPGGVNLDEDITR